MKVSTVYIQHNQTRSRKKT